jgi:hypothetical protein
LLNPNVVKRSMATLRERLMEIGMNSVRDEMPKTANLQATHARMDDIC